METTPLRLQKISKADSPDFPCTGFVLKEGHTLKTTDDVQEVVICALRFRPDNTVVFTVCNKGEGFQEYYDVNEIYVLEGIAPNGNK